MKYQGNSKEPLINALAASETDLQFVGLARNTLFIDLKEISPAPYGHKPSEISEFFIIDNEANVLMSAHIKSVYKVDSTDAQIVSSISQDIISNAPTLMETIKALCLIAGEFNCIVVYKIDDSWFVYPELFRDMALESGIENKCANLGFNELNKVWNKRKDDRKFKQMRIAGKICGEVWSGTLPHGIADALAAKTVWEGMSNW